MKLNSDRFGGIFLVLTVFFYAFLFFLFY